MVEAAPSPGPSSHATLGNAWNRSGSAEPMPVRRSLGETVREHLTKTIYRYSPTQWFAWSEDVDVVKAPVHGDTVNRTIWTGEDYPRFTSTDILGGFSSPGTPTGIRRLGIPKPENKPTLTPHRVQGLDLCGCGE